ncbi:MAG TPA: hypothetical protein VGG30_02800 [Pirellulales bacterium]
MLGHADRCSAGLLFDERPLGDHGALLISNGDGRIEDNNVVGGSIVSLATNLGGGTDTNITDITSDSLDASGGNLDASGYGTFAIESPLGIGTDGTLAIAGAPSDFVVCNIAARNAEIGARGDVDPAAIDTDQERFDHFRGGVPVAEGNVSTYGTPLEAIGAFSVTHPQFCPDGVMQYAAPFRRVTTREASNGGLLSAWF